jgi:HK97 family phage prohead protease
VEVIAPDAFDEALAGNPDVRALFNHNADVVLGRTTAGTLRLATDKVGLTYECDPPDTQAARDLMVSMERKDITQSSFGFICMDAAWGFDEVNGLGIRTVKKAQLFDVSPVTFPAYTASTSGIRSLPADMPTEVRSKLTAGKPDAPENRTDPNFAGCECECPECVADHCEHCSHIECNDPKCEQERSVRHSAKVHAQRVKVARALLD